MHAFYAHLGLDVVDHVSAVLLLFQILGLALEVLHGLRLVLGATFLTNRTTPNEPLYS